MNCRSMAVLLFMLHIKPYSPWKKNSFLKQFDLNKMDL